LGYKNSHEASVEVWAKTLNIPIIEINAAHGDKEINAGSGIINGKGERVRTVKNKGEQLFIYDLAIK
jgi:hypothetical protein